MHKEIIIYFLLLLSLFSFISYISYRIWFLGDNEKDYKIICLNNHEYYQANFMAKGFLAIKMTADGKPSKCQ